MTYVSSIAGCIVKISLLVLFTVAAVACTTPHAGSYESIPVKRIIRTARGEQTQVLRDYGPPARARATHLGTTQWFYCRNAQLITFFEFDSEGRVILSTSSPQEKCSPPVLDRNTSKNVDLPLKVGHRY